jgi:peptide chain release factor 1
MRVFGKNPSHAFRDEAGGHRWQRVPPTEKRGRVHTSTVTVAVLSDPTDADVRLDMRDVDVRTTRGSGPGGQHRNTSDTAVQVTHRPTGIRVRAEDNKSQHINKENALRLLRLRLKQIAQEAAQAERDGSRRQQVGSGMRGDKIRTIQVQNDRVTNHMNGKQMRLKDYLRGNIGEILR